MLVSGAVASSGAVKDLIDAWLAERLITVVTSDGILEEVERALARPYFAKRIGQPERTSYAAFLRREAVIVAPRTVVSAVPADPDDDAVLAAAIDGGVRYLVTGDHQLLELGTYRGVDIVRPRELMEIIGR